MGGVKRGYKQSADHVAKRTASFKETMDRRPKHVDREALSARATKHGMHGTRTYQSWISMRQRCQNPNHTAFARYGGRSIEICERWQSFENFFADMGERPKDCSLDRIDSDGNYEPSNCRWASASNQSRNWRNANHLIEFAGRALTLAQWSEEVGIEHHTLQYRLRKGWPIEQVLNAPVRDNNKKRSDA